ncbi:MAG TPA: iron-containing alcohol dehydrogenase, partial [Candidatus Hydrogenedentes bacterium]|nr:iron-containing alcohol dehydrogenase [Candidatus Hydrogenedentota bacterium]
EGVILTAMEYGPKAIANGNDLEARTQVQYASILALNGWVNSGTNGGFPVHMIEHTVSAYHDITHAAGLAIINPSWMRFAAKANTPKFVQFAERIFGLSAKGPDDLECALAGIDRFEEFLKSIGCPTRFSELDIDGTLIETYARETLRIIHDENGKLPGRPAMTETDIIEVLRSAL